MAYSYQRATSDGTMVLLDISIDYLDRSEITVYFDDVLTSDWSWSGTSDKRILFSPAIPDGVVVMVKRTTDASELRHFFSRGAQFTAPNLDEDLQQALHMAQEASEANLVGDFFTDINMHGFRVFNVGTAVDDTDALTLGQYKADANGAYQSRLAAEAAAASAQGAVSSFIASLASSIGGTLVGWIQSGVNAIKRTVQDKLRDNVSVKDFGAIADGVSRPLSSVTSIGGVNTTGWTLLQWQAKWPHVVALTDQLDWAASQAALNYVTNGTVHFPAGAYIINRTLKVGYNNTTFQNCANIQGVGQGSTILWNGGSNTSVFWYEGTSQNAGWYSKTVIDGMYIKNSNGAANLVGIRIGNFGGTWGMGNGVSNVTIRNNKFIDLAMCIATEYESDGLNIIDNVFETYTVYGVYAAGSAGVRVRDNLFSLGRAGSVAVYCTYSAIDVSDNIIQSTESGVVGSVYLKGVTAFRVTGNYMENGDAGPAWALLIQGSYDGYVGSNTFQGMQGADAIYCDVNSRNVQIGPNSYGFYGYPMASLVRSESSDTTVSVIARQDYVLGPIAISRGSPGILTCQAPGMQNDLPVYLTTDGSLPAGLVARTLYYVVNVSGFTFQLATSIGGTAITTTTAGSGEHTLHIELPNAFRGPGFASRSQGNYLLYNGNFVPRTAGKGLDFGVNTSAAGMTSKVLVDYEEGAWTPAVTASSGTITSVTATGTYTKVGRQVTLLGEVLITNAGTGAGNLRIAGLPFNVGGAKVGGAGREVALTGDACAVSYFSTTAIDLNTYNNASMPVTNRKYSFMLTYFI